MSEQTKIVQSTFPWLSIFGCVLIVLKMTGHITASWWVVTAPFWIPLCLFVGAMILIGGLMILVTYLDSKR